MTNVTPLRRNKISDLPTPITSLAKGWICRAYVCLPSELGRRGRVGEFDEHDRLVIFEVPYGKNGLKNPAAYLQQLLATVWGVDTSEWLNIGYISNVYEYTDFLRKCSLGAEGTGERRFLETGAGGEHGIGPDAIHYQRQANIDLFVTPAVAERLRALLKQIDLLYEQGV